MRRNLVLIGMGLLLVISLFPLLQYRHNYWITSPSVNDPTQPDFVVYHSVTHHYSATGQLKNTLFSEKIAYFKSQHLMQVTRPYVIGYHDKTQYWRITADRADSWQKDHKIELHGHVVLYQPPHDHHPETTVTTTALTYYLDRGIATTQEAVLIRQPNSQFSAVGMEFNLKTGTLVAHAHSRGQYALN